MDRWEQPTVLLTLPLPQGMLGAAVRHQVRWADRGRCGAGGGSLLLLSCWGHVPGAVEGTVHETEGAGFARGQSAMDGCL